MIQLLSLVAWAQQNGVTCVDIAPKEPNHGIAWVILSTFLLIGISVVIMTLLGTGVGFVRILIFKLFPANKFNGPEHEPTIRLKLLDRSQKDTAATGQ
jgi:hypothetical protein